MTGYTGRVSGGRRQAGQRAGQRSRLCVSGRKPWEGWGQGRREGPSCQEAPSLGPNGPGGLGSLFPKAPKPRCPPPLPLRPREGTRCSEGEGCPEVVQPQSPKGLPGPVQFPVPPSALGQAGASGGQVRFPQLLRVQP